MSDKDTEESLYYWYITSYHRKTCPKCGSEKVIDIAYGQDKNGQGIIYRCHKCLYEYGVEDETNRAYIDINSRPTLYWE